MATIVSSQAWDVPNSNMVVVLKKMRERVWLSNAKDRIYYVAGVTTRKGKSDSVGYTSFNLQGDDAYSAFENLMGRIDKAAEFMFRVLDFCDSAETSAIDVVKPVTWEMWQMSKTFDFSTSCFLSMSRMIYLLERGGGEFSVVVHRKDGECNSGLYCAFVVIANESAFQAKPARSVKDAIANLKMAFLGAGAMLEKFQGMAWNVMIDSGDPEYNVEFSRLMNGSSLKRNEKEVVGA